MSGPGRKRAVLRDRCWAVATGPNHRRLRVDGLTLLGSLREELRRLLMNGLTGALRATQASSLMLSDVFNVLENLAALCATILVRRHGTSPPQERDAQVRPMREAPPPSVSSYDDGAALETLFRERGGRSANGPSDHRLPIRAACAARQRSHTSLIKWLNDLRITTSARSRVGKMFSSRLMQLISFQSLRAAAGA